MMEARLPNFEYTKDPTLFAEKHSDRFPVELKELSYEKIILEMKEAIAKRGVDIDKPSVVILGAGPGGLIRALQSIFNGNPTHIVEKRSQDAKKRDNIVVLTRSTIDMLKFSGAYQLLEEESLIFPPDRAGKITVRLGDLEWSLKKVIEDLDVPYGMHYSSVVKRVDSAAGAALLHIKQDQKKFTLKADIVVNCEGANSSTNQLLGIKRQIVLEKIPVVAAIFKDHRPKITGLYTLMQYVAKTVAEIVVTVFYFIKFLCELAFTSLVRGSIHAALVFQVPKQGYVGCLFSNEINEKMTSYEKIIKDQKLTDKERKRAQKELNAYLRPHLIRGVCLSNLRYFVQGFCFESKPEIRSTRIRFFDDISIVHIGADRADNLYKSISSKGVVLLAGDAAATVDPTSGLGCNSAIQSSMDFLEYLWDYDNMSRKELNLRYVGCLEDRIEYIHEISKVIREAYMPTQVEAG